MHALPFATAAPAAVGRASTTTATSAARAHRYQVERPTRTPPLGLRNAPDSNRPAARNATFSGHTAVAVFRRLTIALAVAFAVTAATAVATPAAHAATSPCGRTKTIPTWNHIIVIAFENHSYASVLGAGAPAGEFTRLAGECGVATKFTAAHFPHSLPTYIATTSGQVSITGDCLPGPSCQSGAMNIFGQLHASGWRAYGQSMPSPCAKTNSGDYVT